VPKWPITRKKGAFGKTWGKYISIQRNVCQGTESTEYQYPIANKEGKVKRYCLDTDSPAFQYPIANKKGKVKRRKIVLAFLVSREYYCLYIHYGF